MKQTLEFASHPANLSLVRRHVREFLGTTGFAAKEIELMVLGVDEACANVIRHVYKHEVTHLMALSSERLDTGIRFCVRDFGAQSGEKFASRPLEAVRPGGLGVHLIHNAFDRVEYLKRETGTELVLTKNFPAPGS